MPNRLASLLSTALLFIALAALQPANRLAAQASAQGAGQIVAQNQTEAPPPNACGPTNIACHCSFQCCGEERCDGSICNQCVIDCVQRQQAVDKRSTALRARCQSLMSRGFKRL